MKKKLFCLMLVAIMVVSTALPAFAESSDKSPNAAPKTGVSQGGTSIPAGVTPTKTYSAAVGKSYDFPTALKQAGDGFSTISPTVITIDKTTGRFTATANGTGYIVVTNGATKRYVKIVVGTGTPATTVANGKSPLADYSIVMNKSGVLATKTGAPSFPSTVVYFYSANGTELGSIAYASYEKIIQENGVNNASGVMVPPTGASWSAWFAAEFNTYRDASGYTVSAVPKKQVKAASDYATEVIRLTNLERENAGLAPLEVDQDAMDFAQLRADELLKNYSHNRPNGQKVAYNGISPHENIFKGPKTPAKAVSGWMKSSVHRKNMLHKNAYALGVGVSQSSDGTYYWVQTIVVAY